MTLNTIVRKARIVSAVAMRNTPQLYERPPRNVELAKSSSQFQPSCSASMTRAPAGGPRSRHVDPEDHPERVAEALGNGHDRVDDARAVHILAARARHAAGEDAPRQRKAEADRHERDEAGPEQVAG